MSKQSSEVRSGDKIFLLFVKAPKCLPPGPLGSVVLGQNMDISGRLDWSTPSERRDVYAY
jgi:hypothetical protein